MNPVVVTLPSKNIREMARIALNGKWLKVSVGVLIYWLLTSVVQDLLNKSFTYNTQAFTSDLVSYFQQYGYQINTKIGYGGDIYMIFVGGAFQLGLAYFLITFFRSGMVKNNLIFEGFSNFARTVFLFILSAIKIFLWSMLFIIPGIIAVYRYSQAFNILADHPDWSASMCLRESGRIMMGNKFKLFCLEISFIGWYILANLPSMIFSYFGTTSTAFGYIIDIIVTLPLILVTAYVDVAKIAFYDMASGRLIARRVDLNDDRNYQNEDSNKQQDSMNNDQYNCCSAEMLPEMVSEEIPKEIQEDFTEEAIDETSEMFGSNNDDNLDI